MLLDLFLVLKYTHVVTALNSSSFLARDLFFIQSRKVSTVVFTDSKCLFDTITKLSTEKRHLIDIAAIRENYSNGDLTHESRKCFLKRKR